MFSLNHVWPREIQSVSSLSPLPTQGYETIPAQPPGGDWCAKAAFPAFEGFLCILAAIRETLQRAGSSMGEGKTYLILSLFLSVALSGFLQ